METETKQEKSERFDNGLISEGEITCGELDKIKKLKMEEQDERNISEAIFCENLEDCEYTGDGK